MKTKKIISVVLATVMVASTFCISGVVTASAATNPYQVAAQEVDSKYAYSGNDLGATYSPESTTFKLWAPTASKVVLNLYATGSDKEEGAKSLGQQEMTNTNGVWSVTVAEDLKSVYYTYTVTAASIKGGTESTKETVDPYAKAAGVNGKRSMVVDLASTNPEGWENDKHILLDEQTDASVWEIHVKDFSYNENSGVSEKNRGKYMAFTELGTTLNNAGDIATCVDYLKELGITHVQINPFYDFGSVDEAGSDTQFNWGYDPLNYNVPEGSYSSNPYDGNVRINECKQMIQALHNAGIGVIMDVVYNHTYSTASCFQATVPDYYYRKTAAGAFSNASGCGNDTASERAMYRKYMIDSVMYWASEYHIDGFRFDLMGLHDAETMNLLRAELDKIDPRLITYGEGWSMSSTFDPTTCLGTTNIPATQKNAKTSLNERVACFNDSVRDSLKGSVFGSSDIGFLQGAQLKASGILYGLRANTVGKGSTWQAAAPSQCVTYSSCHDNHTLYDRLVTSLKGDTADFRARYSDLVAMNKLNGAIILSSQGIPFMLAGEEMARSKDGDENSYKSAATINMIDWDNVVSYSDVVSYYKGMLEIRKAFTPFTAGTNDFANNYKLSQGLTASGSCIGYVVDNNTAGEWKTMGVAYNNATTEQKITLDTDVTNWVVIANDQTAGVKSLGEVTGNEITVAPRSAIILVDKASYDAAKVATDMSKVVVKHVDSSTNKVLSQYTIQGTNGTKYQTTADSDLELEYEVASISGDEKGTFGNTDKTVTYNYKSFIPSSLNETNDITGDSRITIDEATKIQKHAADLSKIDEDKLTKADYTCDGKIDIKDATMVQKHLAGIAVGIGTITSNYYYLDDSGNKVAISPSVVRSARVGTEYSTSKVAVNCYDLIETPANATGTVAYGNVEVNYVYKYTGVDINIHVKHNGSATWAPTLWAWDSNKNNAFDAWPGYTFANPADEEGWFNDKFSIAADAESYNIIISNNGTVQTTDYTDITAHEIWIVIDDAKATSKSPWITIYTEKPTV